MNAAPETLGIALSAAVPLDIMQMRGEGGPSKLDWEAALRFGPVLAEQGDRLLYASKGEWQPDYSSTSVARGATEPDTRRRRFSSGEMFTRLSRSVATLAFCPGGVTVFGTLYCARHSPAGRAAGAEPVAPMHRICPECSQEAGSSVIRANIPRRKRRDRKRGRKI